MKKTTVSLLIIFLLSMTGFRALSNKENPKRVVIGYVAGYNGIINTDAIDVMRLTHINYAFVNIKNNRAFLDNESTDTVNFRKLNLLKQKNPDLKIMISIGGWSWSKNFSDAALTDSSRQQFAQSSVDIVRRYGLDGVDIDWEYPNMRGDGNVFRAEDKQNYTLLFGAIRSELDKLTSTTQKRFLLTTAVGGFTSFILNTEMNKAQQYLDYINIMTYDYSWGVAGHHTNLYTSENKEAENSADKAVHAYIKAGVPASKLVMGIAFYGRAGLVADSTGNGLYKKIVGQARGGGYTYLKDSLVNQKGFIRYWDEQAKAPYLFNAAKRHFISYDDEQSVKEKCRYVKENGLGGVMFWEYSSDPKTYLLRAITDNLY